MGADERFSMYQLGSKVVYPGHGVAVIENVTEKVVDNKTIKFFKLKFLYKEMIVLVPTDHENNAVSVRPLSIKAEIDRALNELYKQPKKFDSTDFTPSSWNKRNKTYQLKIQGGRLIDLATIYRDLMHTSQHKDLSFGEKNLLQLAEELLFQEILEVTRKDRETILQELRTPFKQFAFTHTSGTQRTTTISV